MYLSPSLSAAEAVTHTTLLELSKHLARENSLLHKKHGFNMFVFKQNTEGLIHCGITTALDGCNPSQAAPRHAQSHRVLTSNKC